MDPLRVITSNVLGDKNVGSRDQWEEAVGFLQYIMDALKKDVQVEMTRVTGPNWVKRSVDVNYFLI